MFNSRKGVSEVVANILIVLLVIVGIAVIWSVVKPTIDKGAKGIQGDCFTISVQPVSCTSSGGKWTVGVKRNPGAGTFEKIELLFNGPTGETKLVDGGITVLTELSTTSSADIEELVQIGFTPKSVNTVLRVNGQLCQVTSQPIDCK